MLLLYGSLYVMCVKIIDEMCIVFNVIVDVSVYVLYGFVNDVYVGCSVLVMCCFGSCVWLVVIWCGWLMIMGVVISGCWEWG